MNDLTQVFLAILAVIGAVVSTFLIPWLKSKISLNNDQLSENQRMLLKLAISTAVKAAEQLYNSEEGQQKKAYVIKLLEEQGYTVDKGAIDAAIEAAVLELHRELDV